MLEIHDLTKRFGDTTAVDGLSLTAPAGEVLGLVGPNGAGKTTTLKILATLSKPDAGRATIEGLDLVEDVVGVRRIVGYMPDTFNGYKELTTWEYLDFFAAASGLRRRHRVRTVDEVLQLTDLHTRRESLVQSLSRGMLQRLCLAKSLLHNPKLLLLDEPAAGLDPRARIELMALLRELHKMGKTILISSHILADLTCICDRIAIIERGKLVACDRQDILAQRVRRDSVFCIRVKRDAAQACAMLAQLPHVAQAQEVDGQIEVRLNAQGDDHNSVLRVLIDADIPIAEFHERIPDLGEVFMQITTGEI